ncbi:hypothetical protein CCACVL1_01236 [Corchorus capsularis]|uniref:Prolamin-like domain-containing protein n=1 Tax=Corchorus capsularis TaxID=210143 RepID=A0A1R3KKW9_COCAP|nr:hypothetical protein CCACVL1_01236 [Corchorus capsularis]
MEPVNLMVVLIIMWSSLVSKGNSETKKEIGGRYVWRTCQGYLNGLESEVSSECCEAFVRTYKSRDHTLFTIEMRGTPTLRSTPTLFRPHLRYWHPREYLPSPSTLST